MSSIEEFKVIRLYRAYNTILQLCHDRGFVVRHPSAVVEAMADPSVYTEEDGLDYDWFLRHFVITPEQGLAASRQRQASATAAAEGQGGSSGRNVRGSEVGRGHGDDEGADGGSDALDDEELLQRAAGGEYIAMRNAMRLTCGVASSVSSSPTHSPTAGSSKEAKRKQRKEENALMVFFSGAPSLTMKEVQDHREKALRKRASSMIVVASKVPGAVRRDVEELSCRTDPATGEVMLRVQVFEEESLAFNVARHETVPRHVPMTREEVERFLTSRQLNISQLPRMLKSDPMVEYLGLARGDVVRIVRPSKESGPYEMYRQVI